MWVTWNEKNKQLGYTYGHGPFLVFEEQRMGAKFYSIRASDGFEYDFFANRFEEVDVERKGIEDLL